MADKSQTTRSTTLSSSGIVPRQVTATHNSLPYFLLLLLLVILAVLFFLLPPNLCLYPYHQKYTASGSANNLSIKKTLLLSFNV